jgi:hypothetical protein
MFKVIRWSIRPDTNIAFWSLTQEQQDKIKSTYDDTGKRLSKTTELLEDGLCQRVENIWDSGESYEEYKNEFRDTWKERDIYNQEHGILSRRE